YNGFDYFTGDQGLTYSTQPIVFGDRAVQIRDWRIRQVRFDILSVTDMHCDTCTVTNENGNEVDSNHLSVTNKNGNVSRIYRSDGTVRGNVKEWGGYVIEDLGEPTCAYLTSSFLQIGEWRFGEMDDYSGRSPLSVSLPRGFGHLSVTHKSGQTSMIYRDDGTIQQGPRTDYNAWTLVDDEVLAGTKEGCNVGAPAAAAPSASPPPTPTNN
ncbi:hypothetical protein THAOC_34865, partial [Thalassiosira oceanica]